MRFSDGRFQIVHQVKSTKNSKTQVSLHFLKITQSVQIICVLSGNFRFLGGGEGIFKGESTYFIVNTLMSVCKQGEKDEFPSH